MKEMFTNILEVFKIIVFCVLAMAGICIITSIMYWAIGSIWSISVIIFAIFFIGIYGLINN